MGKSVLLKYAGARAKAKRIKTVHAYGSSVFVDEPLYAARFLLEGLLKHLGGVAAAAKAIAATWEEVACFALLQPRYKTQVYEYWRLQSKATVTAGADGAKSSPDVTANNFEHLEVPPHRRARLIQIMFCRFIVAVSPVMLLVDNAHWMDASSLRILAAVAECAACRGAAVVVVSHRPAVEHAQAFAAFERAASEAADRAQATQAQAAQAQVQATRAQVEALGHQTYEQTSVSASTVWLYRLLSTQLTHSLKAPAWFQPLHLRVTSENLLASKFALSNVTCTATTPRWHARPAHLTPRTRACA
jgi:hypothetical protein